MSKLAELLKLTEEEILLMNDLAAEARTNTVAPDISEYVMSNSSVRIALRKARELNLGDKEWMQIIESMTKDETEGT
jgi:hypothetical protein